MLVLIKKNGMYKIGIFHISVAAKFQLNYRKFVLYSIVKRKFFVFIFYVSRPLDQRKWLKKTKKKQGLPYIKIGWSDKVDFGLKLCGI